MTQAKFYYKDKNAPQPKGNRIGACILIEYDGRLLLEHRTDSDTWAVIGGGLKEEERLVEGAVREVFEETGIRLWEEEVTLYGIYNLLNLVYGRAIALGPATPLVAIDMVQVTKAVALDG